MNVPAAPCTPFTFIFGIASAGTTGTEAGAGATAATLVETAAPETFAAGTCLLVKSFDTASILLTS